MNVLEITPNFFYAREIERIKPNTRSITDRTSPVHYWVEWVGPEENVYIFTVKDDKLLSSPVYIDDDGDIAGMPDWIPDSILERLSNDLKKWENE